MIAGLFDIDAELYNGETIAGYGQCALAIATDETSGARSMAAALIK